MSQPDDDVADVADPADLTAAQLRAAYLSGGLSPVEATRAVLDRIEERDPALNAFVLVDPQAALAAAVDSAARYSAGTSLGPGDGIPASIKDIFLTVGWPTRRGSQLIDPNQPWTQDAPCVARLREAGAVLLGKTSTPEFAWKGVTDSALFGATGNPIDPARTAGGSSGGSAAAVGAGMGPWSVGTDGGGSVRIPAAFTGTVAVKPTYGLVPMFPSSPFGTLAHAGPMSRSVTDAALLLDVICGYDARDWSAMPTPPPSSFAEAVARPERGLSGLRIGFSVDLGHVDNDPQVEAAVRAAVEVLADLGAEVHAVDPGFADPVEAFEVLWFTGAAKVLAPFGDEALQRVDPALAAGIDAHRGDTAGHYLDAMEVRMTIGRQMSLLHEHVDVLVTPTVPIPAFGLGLDAPDGVSGWTSWTPYTYPFNMTQQPALSVPCGSTREGLPVGLQIIGPRHGDHLVLRVASCYEHAAAAGAQRPLREE